MKYIMFEQPMGKDTDLVRCVPLLFPNSLTHILVAQALFISPELQGARVRSAGEFSSLDLSQVRLFGKSDTLAVQSRHDDSEILPMYDYNMGIL